MSDFDAEMTTRGAGQIVGLRPRIVRAHTLERIKGTAGPQRIELKTARLVLGRGEGCEIVVESEQVSREHAAFSRVDDEFQVVDLDSRNGVHLNGLKVHLAVLREGDEVQLGDVVYRYQEGT